MKYSTQISEYIHDYAAPAGLSMDLYINGNLTALVLLRCAVVGTERLDADKQEGVIERRHHVHQ